MTPETWCEAFVEILDLAYAIGFRDIRHREGLCVIEIDSRWTAKVNPHDETIDGVIGRNIGLFYNGRFVGMVGIDGGIISGDENELIEAVNTAKDRIHTQSGDVMRWGPIREVGR